ncbi:Putative G protein-coupled receptor GPR1 [Colletotrichum destructivum]|uniref:G protein-coupled receptor GPR1 n=1 Tax=Colletotrichum destructivum TaxID=34406 RepID=A0AAX4ILH0_9PEZI|nr:Putative G protein-coupled receptor GPR1 [Colletotrichum destructivum]
MASWPPDIDVSQSPTAPGPEVFVVHRTAAPGRIPEGLTDRHWTAIQSASLVVAALSFVSTTIAFYWFSRRRRSLRHELIMLLTSSDMLKSLWLIIFPIVDFKMGSVTSESSFCQVSGFFLSVGIEASDVAVVLIALHPVIYLFRSRQSGRRNGGNPHRRLTFSAFAFFPLLMASLAFINRPGYVNKGGYCYLPVRPEWTMLALSWVPRYMILFAIVALYASIYFYVTLRIRRFGHVSAMRRASAEQMPDDRLWSHISPVLLTPSHRGSQASMEGSERQQASSAASTTAAQIELQHSRQKIMWNWPTYGADDDDRIYVSNGAASSRILATNTSALSPTFVPPLSPPQSYIGRDTVDFSSPDHRYRQQASSSTYWKPLSSPTSARTTSLANIWSIIRQGTYLESDPEHNATPFLFHQVMTETRDKIRRQMRFLFVYPLVYTLIWAVPFAAHVMRWDSPEDSGHFAAVLLSLVSLSMQGLVNSCLFCAVEKPWADR